MAIDRAAVIASCNIVDVISKHVDLHKKGTEYYGVCPFHDDDSASLQVNEQKQIYKCFVCGDRAGDAIRFLMDMTYTFPEAVKEITDMTGNVLITDPTPERKEIRSVPQADEWQRVPNAPPLPKVVSHHKHGEPAVCWAYKSAQGEVIGYACRFNFEDGKKMVLPLIYATNGKETKWYWKGLDVPRPLYNLDLITANPSATIIVVEGEKTADAVQAQCDPKKTVVTTSFAGAHGIKMADWSSIYGRPVVFWPDNDINQRYGKAHPTLSGQLKPWYEQAANAGMLAVNDILKEHCKIRRWVRIPVGYPNKWDGANKEWGPGELADFVRQNLIDVPDPSGPLHEEESESEIIDEYGKEPENESEAVAVENFDQTSEEISEAIEKQFGVKNLNAAIDPADIKPPPVKEIPKHDYRSENEFFRMLGFERDEHMRLNYYFFSYAAKTVVRLAPSSMSKANLMQIAPINYWERHFPGGGQTKVDLDAAIAFLTGLSHEIGPFRYKYIRGRGAWMEEDENGEKILIVHTGENLLVGGQLVPLKNYRSRYVYEIGEPLGFGYNNPLETTESFKMLQKLKWLNWEREIDPYILAGWCVIAPFCGVLGWRPHLWLTGPAGSGKTWTLENAVKRLLGDTALAVEGATTEAGIRGKLNSDARPVVFDESDVDSIKDKERIQSILALARAASSDGTSSILKGTQSGGSKSYTIRSCFAFSSIAVQLNQQADRSRFTILSLKAREPNPEAWAKFNEEWSALVTPEFINSFQAKTIRNLTSIIKNAIVFADAADTIIGSRRTADQLGVILAAAYSLYKEGPVTPAIAFEWVNSKDWTEERSLESTKDEVQLFSNIMGQMIRAEGEFGQHERSVGEMVLIAAGQIPFKTEFKILPDKADLALRRIGIMVHEEKVIFANTAMGLKRIIKDTPWSNSHPKVLERLEGAEKVDSRTFYPGLKSRGVSIPLSMVSEGYRIERTDSFVEPEKDQTDSYTSASNPTLQGDLGFTEN